MRALFTVLCFVFVAGCGVYDGGRCENYRYQSQFDYPVKPTLITPSGIAVDPTGQAVSAEFIDQLTDEVETCLADAFGTPPVIPEDVAMASGCLRRTFEMPFHRDCLTVKVPNDWEVACDSEQQVLPLSSTTYIPPDSLCRAKGREPTRACPCRWRAGIQDNNVIVVTPNFYLYKDPLIRLVTGCNNPWASPALARCAAPPKL